MKRNLIPTASCMHKQSYEKPQSNVIKMESEGFIATSGEAPDYGDGGELTQMYNPKPDKNKLIG
ncbi:MAG: hypothetical protein LKM37_04055 [Bacteroidales bacterium]|jgi:hypothetical protein|nr:hypothetical protein [Bacteroidales bacterium]